MFITEEKKFIWKNMSRIYIVLDNISMYKNFEEDRKKELIKECSKLLNDVDEVLERKVYEDRDDYIRKIRYILDFIKDDIEKLCKRKVEKLSKQSLDLISKILMNIQTFLKVM